jgi:hypothetical protein
MAWVGIIDEVNKSCSMMVAGEGVFVIINSIPIDSGPESKAPGTAVREKKSILFVTTFRIHLVWIHGKI